MNIDEINDMTVKKTVHKIAQSARKDKSERKLHNAIISAIDDDHIDGDN